MNTNRRAPPVPFMMSVYRTNAHRTPQTGAAPVPSAGVWDSTIEPFLIGAGSVLGAGGALYGISKAPAALEAYRNRGAEEEPTSNTLYPNTTRNAGAGPGAYAAERAPRAPAEEQAPPPAEEKAPPLPTGNAAWNGIKVPLVFDRDGQGGVIKTGAHPNIDYHSALNESYRGGLISKSQYTQARTNYAQDFHNATRALSNKGKVDPYIGHVGPIYDGALDQTPAVRRGSRKRGTAGVVAPFGNPSSDTPSVVGQGLLNAATLLGGAGTLGALYYGGQKFLGGYANNTIAPLAMNRGPAPYDQAKFYYHPKGPVNPQSNWEDALAKRGPLLHPMEPLPEVVAGVPSSWLAEQDDDDMLTWGLRQGLSAVTNWFNPGNAAANAYAQFANNPAHFSNATEREAWRNPRNPQEGD